jgi:hypothetical protein
VALALPMLEREYLKRTFLISYGEFLGRQWIQRVLRISIVSFRENANTDSVIQPALQFLNVETRFPMLAETCTLEISLPFHLESLCRKI